MYLITVYSDYLIILKAPCPTAAVEYMGRAEMVISHNTDPNQNVLVSCWPNCLILAYLFFFFFFFFKETGVLPKGLFSSLCHLHIPISHKTHEE